MIDNLVDKIQQRTIEKVYEERSEFIIIGLTGVSDDNFLTMKKVLTSDFDKIQLARDCTDDKISDLEHKTIYEYAEKHWKKFDLIKARDIIITYIFENTISLKRFCRDIEKENLFEDIAFCNRIYGALKMYRKRVCEDVTIENINQKIAEEISLFADECHTKGLEKSLLQKNNDLIQYIEALKNKDETAANSKTKLTLYVYTKYILPIVGEEIRKEILEQYVTLFQRYGNEIRFFGTLDITQWKQRLERIDNVEKFDYFYSIAKRINTFIKIRRSPIAKEKSVPIRVVIDSLKNPYEFSFLKDRYSAYYTFAMLENKAEEYDDSRFDEKNHHELYEHPGLIKKRFKKFVQVLVKQASACRGEIEQEELRYLQSLKEPNAYIQYLYEKLEKVQIENEDFIICPKLKKLPYSEEYTVEGIMEEEFSFYYTILNDPIRTFCMLTDLFPFYLQDTQSAVQSADIILGNRGSELELAYQVVKYVSLIMHPGLVPPTKEERCMQTAFNAKVNSGCISRHVGAVVTDKDYNILSIGWNDAVCNKVPCIFRSLRDLKSGRNIEAYSDLELRRSGMFYKYVQKYDFCNRDETDYILDGLSPVYCYKTLYNNLIHGNNPDYSRAMHAEQKAFLDSRKELVEGGCLFTTSSSCENCTMLANKYGVKKIYYIERYPGISQEHVNASGLKEKRAEFILFEGVIGDAYMKLYTPALPLKDELQLRGLQRLWKDL